MSPAQTNSGSDCDPQGATDLRKRKRMVSNRESARRSRMRKQQHLDGLMKEAAQLQSENAQLALQINLLAHQHSDIESGNIVLRTQVMELAERLKSVNSLLRFLEEFSGMAMDIPEIPDPLLKPWQLPCPPQAILATPNMLQC